MHATFEFKLLMQLASLFAFGVLVLHLAAAGAQPALPPPAPQQHRSSTAAAAAAASDMPPKSKAATKRTLKKQPTDKSASASGDDASEHSDKAAVEQALALVQPPPPVELPQMFAASGKKIAKDNNVRGNQHNRKPEGLLTKKGAQKRVLGKLHGARVAAPQHVQDKWDAIAKLQGKKNAGVNGHKQAFLMAWVSNPEWTDAYFSQKLTMSEVHTSTEKSTWITLGRLESLIGKEEAAIAVQEQWWATKAGVGSQVLINYNEKSTESTERTDVQKELRGGTGLAVEDGKKMMVDSLSNSWGMGMYGVERPPSEDEAPEPLAQPMGVLRSLPASSNAGLGESRLEKLKRLSAEQGAADSETQPTNKRLAIADSPRRPVCKRPASAAEKKAAAKEKKEADEAAAKKKKAALAEAAQEQKTAAAKAALEAQEQQKANLPECISFSLSKAMPVKASPA